jgi:hypothetical protein
MSRKFLSISDSQGAYCDICRGKGYGAQTANYCVKYETDTADPPFHIRHGSWCSACAADALALLGGTDKDFRFGRGGFQGNSYF